MTQYSFNPSKTYLVLTDSLSSLIAATIDSLLVSGANIVVVTSKSKVQQEITEKIGITPFHIPVPPLNDDHQFFLGNMPGSLEDLVFEGFPLWKGLSIDRLRFWQVNNDLLKKFIEKIDFDISIIDLDLMSRLTSLPIASYKESIVVKNATLRTPEIYSFLQKLQPSAVITDKEMDIPYLDHFLDTTKKVWAQEIPFEPPIDKVYGPPALYYDKRYIWQFNEYVERHEFVPPISFDERSIEVFSRCHPVGGMYVLPPSAIATPETLVMFAYDEQAIDAIKPKRVVIYDPYGVNMAEIMAIGDERVTVL
jgi:hypothetical protein